MCAHCTNVDKVYKQKIELAVLNTEDAGALDRGVQWLSRLPLDATRGSRST